MARGRKKTLPLRRERNVLSEADNSALLKERRAYPMRFQSINVSFLRNGVWVILLLLLAFSPTSGISANQLRRSRPAAVRISSEHLSQRDPVIA